MINPYKIELRYITDPLSGEVYPYYFVYDLNGNFIERYFYGDRTKPGFGENGWIYTDNNAYNLEQLKKTVYNSFDQRSIDRFNKTLQIMNETGLPYHLALTLIKNESEKEIPVVDEPVNIPVVDEPVNIPVVDEPVNIPIKYFQDVEPIEQPEIFEMPLINVYEDNIMKEIYNNEDAFIPKNEEQLFSDPILPKDTYNTGSNTVTTGNNIPKNDSVVTNENKKDLQNFIKSISPVGWLAIGLISYSLLRGK